jgi:hypothetical protein
MRLKGMARRGATMLVMMCSVVFVGLVAAQSATLTFQPSQYTRLDTVPGTPVVNGAGLFTSFTADLRRNGKHDLFIGMGTFPPTVKTAMPLRVLRAANGGLTDVTRQLFGNGTIPQRIHPREVITADFNGDGRPDIFVAAHGWDTSPFEGERNVLMISRADGAFEDRSATLPSDVDFSHSTTAADINGDGFIDIYVGQVFGGARVPPYFLMGRGDGTFTQRTNNLLPAMLTLGRKFVSSLLVDVNGDGFPDLVLGTDHDGGNADNIILLNDGAGDYTKRPEIKLPRSAFGTNQNTMDIVAQDLNADGHPDLIICGTGAQPFYVGRFLQVLINNGDGTYRDESSARLVGTASKSTGGWNKFIRTVDMNGDGAFDLVINVEQGYSEAVDIIWLNDGKGRFTAVSSTVLANPLSSVEVVDVDEDGRPDLVEVSAFEGYLQYRVFFNRTPVKALSRRAVNDLEGAGKSALVVANQQNQLQAGRLVGNQLQWTTLASPPVGFRPLGLFDMQGNGKSDLPMLNLTQGDRGDAVVWPDLQQSSAITLRQVRTLWRVDVTGDLDGDGKGDIVWRFTGNSGNIDDTGVSYVWFTDGSGVTQVRKRGGAPLDWTLLGAADLNGDGADDMLYVSPSNAMRALMATPSRTCANISAGALPSGTTALRMADFSGNRRGDVLAINQQNEVRLYMLSGVGLDLPPFTGAADDPNASCTPGGSRFVSQTTKLLGSVAAGWRYLASGDFDGNGAVDIAWLQPNGTVALWLLNLGDAAPTIVSNAGTLPAGYTAYPLH